MTVPDPRDCQAVTNLLQAYSRATDCGDRAALAALFTPQAHWDGRAVGARMTTGGEAAAEAICEHHDPARPMTHFVGPAALDLLDDGRMASWAWCIATRISPDPQGGGPRIRTLHFEYDDVLVRSGEGWLFESRILSLRFSV